MSQKDREDSSLRVQTQRPHPDDPLSGSGDADARTVVIRHTPTSMPELVLPAAVAAAAEATRAVAHRTVFGDYELLEEVGRGGMGVVFKARQRSLNRIVALKVTQASVKFSEQEVRKRLQVEAAATARLDHPHIVPIHEIGEEDGQHFIAMAFVEGKSLAKEVAAGPLPPRRAAELMLAVGGAVAHAHAQGVIHRDLKPDNILLDAAGLPRVTDFGLAKCADTDVQLTRAGEVFGTPGYMPPEQVQGMDRASPLSDVYALGATLYCLLTGRPPFQAATPLDTVKQVLEREPVPPRQLNPAVDRDLDTICLKCLEKRPDRRYASAAALSDDLARFLAGRSIQARRVHSLEKAVRWCRRNPTVAASLAGAAGIFLAAFLLVSWSYWRAEEARKEAVRQGELERWERYRSHIAAAASALNLNNLSTAKRFLETAPEEHRGWEWRHFVSQLDGAQCVLDVGVPRKEAPLTLVSPCGKQLVLVTRDGEVQRWDLAKCRQKSVIHLPIRDIVQAALSPDGAHLATGSKDGTIRIWPGNGKGVPVVLKDGFHKGIRTLVFDLTGGRLMATSLGEPGIRLWETATCKLVAVHETAYSATITVAPDFSRLVYSENHILLSLAGMEAKGPPVAMAGHQANHACFRLDPGATLLASASMHPENMIRLWDVVSGKTVAVLTGHKNTVTWVAFSPDSQRLVSASADQTLRLWDVKSGALLSVLTGHTDRVVQVVISPDGTLVVSASLDGTARLWDAKTGSCLGVLRGHTHEVAELHFSGDGRQLVTRSVDATVRIWDLHQFEVMRAQGHGSYVYDVAFSPNGKQIASVGWDGKMLIWDQSARQLVHQLQHKNPIVSSVSINGGGNRLATLSRDYRDEVGRTVTIWNAHTGAKVHSIALKHSFFKDARAIYHPDKELIAVGHVEGSVFLFDAATGTKVATLDGPRQPILDVAFHPGGTQLTAGSADGTLCVWNSESHELIATWQGHKEEVWRVLYNPGGKLLASASADHIVRLWRSGTHELAAELAHGCTIYGLAFSPDGKRLATACADNTIRLWDMSTFQEVAQLRGHEAYVHTVAFSPDGTQLVSGSGDHLVRIWDTLSPRERSERED